MKDENVFGRQVASLRRERGYSQFQLARLLHVSDKAVSKWENGGAKPRTSTMKKLAEMLDVDIGELFVLSESTSRSGGRMNKQTLWRAAENRLYELYGDEPDLLIIDRFKAEQNTLRDMDAIVLFAAVAKTRRIVEENHALMTVRGCVNGSFVAWLLGATDINPLVPHSYCPNCKKIKFYPDAFNGWDLAEEECSCGEMLSLDGHGLPFGTYCEKSGSIFTSIDIVIPERIASEAWREILSSVQEHYTCNRHVSKQDESTGFPGNFSTLYLHPRKNDVIYKDIEEVPEISDSMNWKILTEVPHITVLGSRNDRLVVDSIPKPHEIINDSLIQRVREEKSAMAYKYSGPLTFQGLVQAEAASHMTLVEGCDLDNLARSYGLKGYAELPLTREDVWKLVMDAQNGSEAIAADIVFNLRRGKYSKKLTDRDRSTMRRTGLPEWFPEYASSVVYLFPKAHCTEFAWHDLVREWAEHNRTV